MTDAEDILAYRSPEVLARLCRHSAMRLHDLHRVAIGESNFAWHVAEALANLGRAFGSGWERGILSEAQQRAFLGTLLFEDVNAPVPESIERPAP